MKLMNSQDNSAMPDTVTIPRALFEQLTDAACELKAEWDWKSDEPCYAGLFATIAEAVKIRDQKQT